jgi:hypothetical protein
MMATALELHDKHFTEISAITDFLDWLSSEGYAIVSTSSGPVDDTDALIWRRFGIDRQQLEVERRELLKELRADDDQ